LFPGALPQKDYSSSSPTFISRGVPKDHPELTYLRGSLIGKRRFSQSHFAPLRLNRLLQAFPFLGLQPHTGRGYIFFEVLQRGGTRNRQNYGRAMQ
jgi:hypothetical protein